MDQCPELDPGAEWSWVLEEPESALDTLLRLQQMGDLVYLEWPQGRKIQLTPPATLRNMQVSARKQRDWFALAGELVLSSEQVLSMKQLLELLGQSPGRFVHLGEGEFLTLTKELRQRLEALQAISDKGRFHPLASPAVEEITDGMEVKAAATWREQLARLSEARTLQSEPPRPCEHSCATTSWRDFVGWQGWLTGGRGPVWRTTWGWARPFRRWR